MPTEPLTIRKSTYDFAMLVAGQIVSVGLSQEVETHYLAQKQEVAPAFHRGFTLPGAILPSAVPVEMAGHSIEETDCILWLGRMEKFAEQRFGVKVVLRDMFPIPACVPWKQVLPIFIPPDLTNRQMVDQALKAQNISVGEGTNVEEFIGANGNETARLYLIERTPKPTTGTMGLPPKYARQWFSGRQTRPLNLCGYGIGNGLLYQFDKSFLDPHAVTASWFPENTYPSSGGVACGYYVSPGYRKAWFSRDDAGYEYGNYGFREAILLLPKT